MSLSLDFPGNPRLARQLEHALASGRVAGSYLFEGAPGAGQEQAAVALAAGLIAGSTDPSDSAARRVLGYTHPDLHLLIPIANPGGKSWGEMSEEELSSLFQEQQGRKTEDPYYLPRSAKAPHLPVEALRATLRTLALKPFEGRAKVLIIRDADRLWTDAQDTLLKALEEPPTASHIVLISARPEALRPTILSRCQRLPFDPLPLEAIARLLSERGLASQRAAELARLAEGNLERAVELGDADGEDGNPLLAQREAWFTALERCDFGSELEMMDAVGELVRAGGQGNLAQERADFLSLALSWYRELLHRNLGVAELDVHRDQEVRLARYRRLSAGALVERIQRCEKARGQILGNVHAELTLLSLFFSFRSGAAAPDPA